LGPALGVAEILRAHSPGVFGPAWPSLPRGVRGLVHGFFHLPCAGWHWPMAQEQEMSVLDRSLGVASRRGLCFPRQSLRQGPLPEQAGRPRRVARLYGRATPPPLAAVHNPSPAVALRFGLTWSFVRPSSRAVSAVVQGRVISTFAGGHRVAFSSPCAEMRWSFCSSLFGLERLSASRFRREEGRVADASSSAHVCQRLISQAVLQQPGVGSAV
jgi:hypothetical protein